jgi:dipeptidyl aminopeptidase/acylaminoacyl peptidase
MYGSNPWQGAWIQNGDILVRQAAGLFRFPLQGGALAPIPSSSDTSFPTFLSDGQRFLARVNGVNGSSIQLGALGSAVHTLVIDNVESAPVLAPTPGAKTYLMFLHGSDLMAQEFDVASGKVLGNPTALIPHIGRVGNPAVMPTVGVSPTGILAYQTANQAATRQLRLVDRSGLPVRTFSPDVSLERPRLSPDQSSVAGERLGNIWVTELVRESSDRKTLDDTSGTSAVWSKDGSRIAFLRPQRGIYAIDVRGSGKPELLVETQGLPTSWSGKHLLYSVERKLYVVDLGGDKKPIQITPDGISDARGEFSPDGNYIAYNSDRSGRKAPDGGIFHDVYVQPLRPGARETRVSLNAGRMPRWRGDGKEIFFVSFDGDLMAADIKLGDPVLVGKPHKLFHFDSRSSQEVVTNGYDVTRDGQQFLIVSPLEELNSPITVVLNWWVEVEKRSGR